jgi:hypothetical protein
MFLFQYHEDNLHLLKEERKRDERGRRHLREMGEPGSAVSPTRKREASGSATPRTAAYTGPERRMVPCPDMKEAMTP